MVFVLLPFSHTFPHYLPPPFGANPPQKNLFHPPVLRFYRRENIKDKKEEHNVFASLK
jgi:hypothetical protein